MIVQICLYCKEKIGIIEEDNASGERISHGVCPSCFPKFVAGSGTSFSDYLNSFLEPIFLIDPDARIIWANERAKELTEKNLSQLEGNLYGEIFECNHASQGSGCGTTIHCKSCTIRQTIKETAETGKSCYKIPAFMDLGDQVQERSARFLISTEKAGEVLLLKIEHSKN